MSSQYDYTYDVNEALSTIKCESCRALVCECPASPSLSSSEQDGAEGEEVLASDPSDTDDEVRDLGFVGFVVR